MPEACNASQFLLFALVGARRFDDTCDAILRRRGDFEVHLRRVIKR
jgi:hypothetical protein